MAGQEYDKRFDKQMQVYIVTLFRKIPNATMAFSPLVPQFARLVELVSFSISYLSFSGWRNHEPYNGCF
jgi:hypothetical protein